MKCIVCKTGNIVISGCHEYCNNCPHMRFVMTDDYVAVATSLLVVVCSNTRFTDENSFGQFVAKAISQHCPKLQGYIIETQSKQFVDNVIQGIISNAINLQIDATTHNREEDKSFKCVCGNPKLEPVDNSPFIMRCTDPNCMTEYKLKANGYEPLFECECGCINYQDMGGGLAACAHCLMGYMYNKKAGTFGRLNGE